MTTTHTTTDPGPLDRFTERWRKHQTNREAGEAEAKLLRKMQTGYSLRCGQLYRYCFEFGENLQACEDNCRSIARLHSFGLLAIEAGQIHASEAGLALLKEHPLKR